MGNPEERLDVINEQDEVVGSATKPEIFSQRLRHRVVHIFLFDRAGNIALQKRSSTVRYCPDHWCSSAAGHVQAGESYMEAALRELQEEIGVTTTLTEGQHIWFTKLVDQRQRMGVFTGRYDDPFTPSPREVSEVQFFSRSTILDMIASGTPFHPQCRFLIEEGFI